MTAATPRISKAKTGGTGEYATAAIVNLVILMVINLWVVWRPWTRGVVTGDWVRVLWAANLSAGVQAGGSLLLAFTSPSWLVKVLDLAFALVTVLSAAIFFAVFPFDFSRIDAAWFNTAARLLLLLGVIGAGFAVVLSAVRLFGRGGGPRGAVPAPTA